MNLTWDLMARELAARPRRRRFHVGRVLFVLGGAAVLMAGFGVSRSTATGPVGLGILVSLSVALVADFAFNVELLLIASVLVERALKSLRMEGAMATQLNIVD